jgi:hypothetical protein
MNTLGLVTAELGGGRSTRREALQQNGGGRFICSILYERMCWETETCVSDP